MKIILRKLLQEKSAATAVEFALLLPILIILTLGAFEIAIALYKKNQLANAVSIAQRQLQINQAADAQQIKTKIADALINIDSDDVLVTLSDNFTSDGFTERTVTISHNYDFILPLLSVFSVTLRENSSIIVE